MRRAVGTVGLALLATFAIIAPASAFISPTRDGNAIAAAVQASVPLTGSFDAITQTGSGGTQSNATANTPLTKFPRSGADYGIMTTGNAALAEQPNTSGESGTNLLGPNVRGDSDVDVSVLKLSLNVPPSANCLALDFRFLSEEYPEFVNAGFNDAFVAELDTSDWTTSGGEVIAPHDFAGDPGDPITVDGVGSTNVAAERATGTTYDAATRLLRATTPVTPGLHKVYLSIFDQGDRLFDSAVFVDNLTTLGQSTCAAGAEPVDSVDPQTTFLKKLPNMPRGKKPSARFESSKADSTYECKLDRKDWKPCTSPEKLKKLKPRKHKFQVRAIDTAGNVDPTPAKDKFKVSAG